MQQIRLVTLTVLFIDPGHNDDARNGRLSTKVDHPDGLLDVEVVEYGAAVYRLIRSPVHCPGRLRVNPLALDVSFVLSSTTVYERLLTIGQILH